MIYVGIDPGKSGGYAVIHNDTYVTYPYDDKGFIEKMIDVHNDRPFLDEEVRVCLEKVHAMPQQGVVSTFNFGKSFGFLEGVLQTLDLPYQLVTPQQWKKEFSLSGSKELSIEVCRKLFPSVNLLATARCRKPHDGMAEALLMAEYARRKF